MIRQRILVIVSIVLVLNGWACQGNRSKVGKSPEPGTVFMYPERIPLKDGGLFNAERGMMFMPVNRSKKNNEVIAVEVYRFRRSEKANPDTPPIFYLFGGPSFGGLESQLETPGYFEEQWLPFLDVSDVVVVSQRGIGPSKPTTLIETTGTPQPPDQAYDDKNAIAEFQRILEREKNTWLEMGLDLSGFTVVEAAADVNDVRLALGYERIVIWGGSFGSHWGMTIMRNYPETIERAVLRGMEGPDHTYDHPGWIWNVYKRVAEEAEASPELEGLIPEGGLIKAAETVVNRVKENPVWVRVSDTEEVLIDFSSIKRLARGYSPGLRGWPADIITLYNGNFQRAAEQIVRRYKTSGRSFGTASFWMLDCGSGITAERLAEFEGDPAQQIIGSTYWFYSAGCPVWGSDLGDDFRQNFETDIPTVIVHGTWDTSTPYENALELVPYFKNSKFIPLIRGPHGAIQAALRIDPRFKEGIMRFAETGDMSGLPDVMEMPPVKWIVPEL